MLRDLMERNRSYRRFAPDVPIDRDTLIELVDLARHAPSAANLQPLKKPNSTTLKRLKCVPTTRCKSGIPGRSSVR